MKTNILLLLIIIFSCSKPELENNDKSLLLCFEEECFRDTIKTLINSAKKSIDIALYEFYNEEIASLLIDSSKKGVKIRAVSDYDSEKNTGWAFLKDYINIVFGNSNGIMHNKYMIIDKRFVLTGSLNLTSDLGKNYNSILVIDSKDIAGVYQEDFDKMFLEKNFSSNKEDTGCITLDYKKNLGYNTVSAFFTPYKKCYENINGSKILIDDPYTTVYDPQDYTNPIGYKILPLIQSANKSIIILAFSLTDKLIFYNVKEKLSLGVKVNIYLDYSQFKSNYKYIHQYLKELSENGAIIKITSNKYIKLHHKIIVIDKEKIILGSMNFSNNAVSKNDENSIFIEDSGNLYPLIEKEITKIDKYSYELKNLNITF